jgi:hypothetical protein
VKPPETLDEILKTAHLQVAKLLKKSKQRALLLQEVQQLALLARVVSDATKQDEKESKKISTLTDEELRAILKEELKPKSKPKKKAKDEHPDQDPPIPGPR